MVIMFQISTMTFMFLLGIQEASSALIGNHIGALNISLAKRYTRVIICLSLVTSITLLIVLFTSRAAVVNLFTNDQVLIDLCMSVFPVYVVCTSLYSVLGVYQGCVRALGIQMKTMLVSICCLWGVSIPLSYMFAFTELD